MFSRVLKWWDDPPVFPRSRKTVTAAFLKRAAKRRNNVKARSKK